MAKETQAARIIRRCKNVNDLVMINGGFATFDDGSAVLVVGMEPLIGTYHADAILLFDSHHGYVLEAGGYSWDKHNARVFDNRKDASDYAAKSGMTGLGMTFETVFVPGKGL